MNYDKLAASGVASAEQMKKAAEMQQQAWDNVMKVLNEGTIHDIKMRNGGGGGRKVGGSSASSSGSNDPIAENTKRITELSNEYITATDARRQAIEKEIGALKLRNEEMQKLKDMAQGKTFDAGELNGVTVTGNKNRQYGRSTEGNIGAVISNMQNEMKNADLGSAVYDSIATRLADANAFKNIMQTAMQAGLNDMVVDSSGIWKQITNGENIDDSVWQKLVDNINEKLKELNIDPIKINFETGDLAKTGKDTEKSWKQAAQAVASVGSAMQQIEDPGIKIAGIIGSAIANIALGFAEASKKEGKGGVWYWIAATAAGLATMITTISSIHSATGYADGGIVKGNHYSGDNINGGEAMVNAGELVLNKAQQSTLASQLQDGNGGGGGYLPSHVSGEQIYVVLNRYLKRTGRGELVTWE
jgi:hypothetical protein